MTLNTVYQLIIKHKNCLCVGLDTDVNKLPLHLPKTKQGILAFNKQIIEATQNHCVAYKINTAFYESLGLAGWEIMEETLSYIPTSHFKIADAKRADIGNTSKQYAHTFFDTFAFDAVTVAPYMGYDSVEPFLAYTNKTTIILGLTSNPGSANFQMLPLQQGGFVYEEVIRQCATWGNENHVIFVVGATKANQFQSIRQIIPNHFLLVPGIGAQGGDLSMVIANGKTDKVGLLINVGRDIMYKSNTENFAEEAASSAMQYCNDMKKLLWHV